MIVIFQPLIVISALKFLEIPHVAAKGTDFWTAGLKGLTYNLLVTSKNTNTRYPTNKVNWTNLRTTCSK